MVKYTSYDFYVGEYRGQITEEEFSEQIGRSSAYIQRITFGRSDLPELSGEIQEAVKLAACAVCDVRAAAARKLNETGGREVTAENNDGYSVTYAVEQQGELQEAVLQRKSYAAAGDYLIPTGLLNWEV